MSDALITTLKTLKLFGMADTIANLAEQASPAYQQAVPILETLLKAEVAERDVRSINLPDEGRPVPGVSGPGGLRVYRESGR